MSTGNTSSSPTITQERQRFKGGTDGLLVACEDGPGGPWTCTALFGRRVDERRARSDSDWVINVE